MANTVRRLALAAGLLLGTAAAVQSQTPTPACDTTLSSDTTTIAPRPISEEAPPDGPGRPRRGVYHLTLTVTETGLVDTAAVTIEPALPSRYDKAFRRTLLRYRFRPALRRGCPRRGTFSYEMSFY